VGGGFLFLAGVFSVAADGGVFFLWGLSGGGVGVRVFFGCVGPGPAGNSDFILSFRPDSPRK